MAAKKQLPKTEEEWKARLTPDRYRVLRGRGTELPFTGKLLFNKEKGTYVCAACGQELFSSETKFDSHCGWPSFYAALADKVELREDKSFGMARVEVVCRRCGSHLGHVFEDGPKPTGKRYCINSLSLEFRKVKESREEGKKEGKKEK